MSGDVANVLSALINAGSWPALALREAVHPKSSVPYRTDNNGIRVDRDIELVRASAVCCAIM